MEGWMTDRHDSSYKNEVYLTCFIHSLFRMWNCSLSEGSWNPLVQPLPPERTEPEQEQAAGFRSEASVGPCQQSKL